MLNDDIFEGNRGNDEDKAALVMDDDDFDDSVSLFMNRISSAVNFTLLVAKTIVFSYTISIIVLGSMFESLADIFGQVIFVYSNRIMSAPPDPQYPAGKTMVEAMAIISCAWFMLFSSVATIVFALIDAYVALTTEIYRPGIDLILYMLLIIGIALKVILYFCCSYAINHTKNKELMAALAFDHGREVISNTVTIVCLLVANNTEVWYIDPLGASLVAAYTFYCWIVILGTIQAATVGISAPEDFIRELRDEIQSLAVKSNSLQFLGINRCIVYQKGVKYIAEIEIAFDKNTQYAKTCEVAVAILGLIESRDEVERAFVYVDIALRMRYLHRFDRDHFKEDASPERFPPRKMTLS